jgi:hypothetical protein
MTRARDLIALAAAVTACTAVVLLPNVARSAIPAADPATLAGAWPNAHPFDIPGTVLSNWAYQPQVIVAGGESIGTAKSPDGTVISLVDVDSRRSPASVRVVQSGLDSKKVSFDAFAVTGTDVYFMRNTTNDAGYGTESLWRLPRTGGGGAIRVVADAGEALFDGSIDDIQVAAATLRWIATAPDDESKTVLESMSLPAGPVSTRLLDGQYTLTTYPMLYSGQLRDPATPQLTDSSTGKVSQVHITQPSGASCDPQWCVMLASDTNGAYIVQLCRPDGSALTHLGDGNTHLAITDPTLLDRFVALTEQTQAMINAPNPTEQLWLYDIGQRHDVEITGAASAVAGAGGWLWWSTGDNETLTWHALDLTALH